MRSQKPLVVLIEILFLKSHKDNWFKKRTTRVSVGQRVDFKNIKVVLEADLSLYIFKYKILLFTIIFFFRINLNGWKWQSTTLHHQGNSPVTEPSSNMARTFGT